MNVTWITFTAAVICLLLCCKAFTDSQYEGDKFWMIAYGIQAILLAIIIAELSFRLFPI